MARLVLVGSLLLALLAPLHARAQGNQLKDVPPVQPAAAQGIDLGPLEALKFSGLLQVWYQGGDQGFLDTFRLRRLRLYLNGQITPRAKFMVMVDLARALVINQERVTLGGANVVEQASVNQASRLLQDAYVTIGLVKHLEVTAGQFKLPLNYEGLAPVQELPFVERSLMTIDRLRGGMFGDLREVGVMARGTFDSGLEYRIGVFNGLGTRQNDVDTNDRKAVSGRVAYRTPLPGLQVGAFGAWDRDAATSQPQRRTGIDVRYQRGLIRLEGELVSGLDGPLERRGYYAGAVWRLRPAFEVAGRLDVFDPDTRFDRSRADVRERDYVGAASYLISGYNLKWQAEYLRKTYAGGIVPSQHVFLSNLQVAW